MIVCFKKSKLIPAILAFAVVAGIVTLVLLSIRAHQLNRRASAADDALVRLFSNAIQEKSDLFYEPYYTAPPDIAFYSTTVKRIEKKGSQIYVTFYTLPYVGAHNTIGDDEITFSINNLGEIAMMDFKHLANRTLPDHLKDIAKGMPPPITDR